MQHIKLNQRRVILEVSTRKKPKGAIHNELHVDAGVLESPIVSTSRYMAYTQTPNKGEERRKMVQTITDRDFPQTGLTTI